MAGFYLETYCTQSGVPAGHIQRWLPVVAAARLNEQYHGKTNQIMEWVDRV